MVRQLVMNLVALLYFLAMDIPWQWAVLSTMGAKPRQGM